MRYAPGRSAFRDLNDKRGRVMIPMAIGREMSGEMFKVEGSKFKVEVRGSGFKVEIVMVSGVEP